MGGRWALMLCVVAWAGGCGRSHGAVGAPVDGGEDRVDAAGPLGPVHTAGRITHHHRSTCGPETCLLVGQTKAHRIDASTLELIAITDHTLPGDTTATAAPRRLIWHGDRYVLATAIGLFDLGSEGIPIAQNVDPDRGGGDVIVAAGRLYYAYERLGTVTLMAGTNVESLSHLLSWPEVDATAPYLASDGANVFIAWGRSDTTVTLQGVDARGETVLAPIEIEGRIGGLQPMAARDGAPLLLLARSASGGELPLEVVGPDGEPRGISEGAGRLLATTSFGFHALVGVDDGILTISELVPLTAAGEVGAGELPTAPTIDAGSRSDFWVTPIDGDRHLLSYQDRGFDLHWRALTYL